MLMFSGKATQGGQGGSRGNLLSPDGLLLSDCSCLKERTYLCVDP